MIDIISLSMAMMAGQASGTDSSLIPPPIVPRSITVPSVLPSTSSKMPEMLPSVPVKTVPLNRGTQNGVLTSTPTTLPTLPTTITSSQVPLQMPMTITPKIGMPMAPLVPAPVAPKVMAPAVTSAPTYYSPLPTAVAPAPAEAPKEEAPKEEEKAFFMKTLEGTYLGSVLEEKKIVISGWTAGSYTGSTTRETNLPVTWNDRANRFLLQQHWTRIAKAVDTESKDINYGFQIDVLFGTDYRFTLPRGLFNSQLLNSNGTTQNLYGVDPIQFFVAAYLPDLFQGTEVRVGRLFTPWGYESVEAVSTPLMSRSYAFNYSPPFTHVGAMLMPKFSDSWSGKFMIANGNDVFIDPSEELRAVGAITYANAEKKTSTTFGYTLGRGKFNTGDPFNPTTSGLLSEPAGRNNINVLDLVHTRELTEELSYGLEAIYGWQTGVPTNVPGGIIKGGVNSGTAHWGSLVHYFTYKFNDKLSSITRLETFDDFEGQRTGFEGLYTAITFGMQYKPSNAFLIRPEIRYDYNGYSKPFEGRRDILTVGGDIIFKF